MPGTAQQVAKQTGLAYSQEKLLTTDAGYNATLGAAFLGQQLARFDGSYILTFAGYNAGPRRADQWIKRYGTLAARASRLSSTGSNAFHSPKHDPMCSG
jgi:soluble lytic murein transglycosylase